MTVTTFVRWEHSTCLNHDPETWFQDAWHPEAWDTPRQLCRRCPVRQACLDQALEEEAGYGIQRIYGMRGGLTPAERHQLNQQRGCHGPDL